MRAARMADVGGPGWELYVLVEMTRHLTSMLGLHVVPRRVPPGGTRGPGELGLCQRSGISSWGLRQALRGSPQPQPQT